MNKWKKSLRWQAKQRVREKWYGSYRLTSFWGLVVLHDYELSLHFDNKNRWMLIVQCLRTEAEMIEKVVLDSVLSAEERRSGWWDLDGCFSILWDRSRWSQSSSKDRTEIWRPERGSVPVFSTTVHLLFPAKTSHSESFPFFLRWSVQLCFGRFSIVDGYTRWRRRLKTFSLCVQCLPFRHVSWFERGKKCWPHRDHFFFLPSRFKNEKCFGHLL